MSIRKVIKKKGWTLERLAAQMRNKDGKQGVTQATVSQILSGNPTLDKLKEIASIIGVSVSELLREDEEENFFVCPNCGAKLELKKKAN